MTRWSRLLLCLFPMLAACAHEPARMPVPARTITKPPEVPAHPRRGILDCEEDRACGKPVSADAPGEPAPPGAEDVSIRFLRITVQGEQRPLQSGATLAPGDVFTILIDVHRDAHLYLWHADPDGRLVELVSAAGVLGARDCTRSNRVWTGQRIQLPAPGGHYTLDRRPGIERIYPVVSATPLCEGSRSGPTALQPTGTQVTCPAPAPACAQPFVIRHLTEV